MATNLSTSFTTWVNAPNSPSTPGAADINRLQGNDTFFAEVPSVRLRRTTVANIPHSTEQAVGFNLEDLDSDGGFDVANSQQIFVRMTGWYDVRAYVMWTSPSGGAAPAGYRRLTMYVVRGSTATQMDGCRVDQAPNPTANFGTGQHLSPPLLRLFNGDIVEVRVQHNQGSTLVLDNAVFSLHWVRR